MGIIERFEMIDVGKEDRKRRILVNQIPRFADNDVIEVSSVLQSRQAVRDGMALCCLRDAEQDAIRERNGDDHHKKKDRVQFFSFDGYASFPFSRRDILFVKSLLSAA
jgi:hypothetical protein